MPVMNYIYYIITIKNSVHLTVGNSSKLLEQFNMRVWLNGGGDVRLTARSI